VSILAARLMQAASDDVLVCAQTRRLAARSVDFVDLPPVSLQGFAAPQPVSRPVGRRVARTQRATRLAGRSNELGRVAARLDSLREGRGGVVLLEAEPGMGRSVMLQAARELAAARGAVVFDGSADSIEVATPYYAVRGAVLDLLGVPPGSSAARARELALSRLDADVPELAWLAPLLDAVVPIDLPDSPESAQIVGTTRAERLGDLVVGLVRAAVARVPVIWSIEDLHWADRASWSLCLRLVEEVAGMLLLGTTRPMPSPTLERERLARSDREVIVLDDLPAAALGEIVAMRLGVSELPGPLLALLVARADGNPSSPRRSRSRRATSVASSSSADRSASRGRSRRSISRPRSPACSRAAWIASKAPSGARSAARRCSARASTCARCGRSCPTSHRPRSTPSSNGSPTRRSSTPISPHTPMAGAFATRSSTRRPIRSSPSPSDARCTRSLRAQSKARPTRSSRP
jgi:hypothetical protein